MNTEVVSPLVGFKRNLRAEVADGVTYLFSERGMTTLRGSDITALAPLLDGTRSLAAVLDEAPDEMEWERVMALIGQLTQAGLVSMRQPDGTVEADEPTLAYWETVGIDAEAAVASTAVKQIGLFTAGDVDVGAAWTALRSAGLTVTAGLPINPADLNLDLSICVVDDYLSPCLAEMDAAHRVANVPWMLVKPGGAQVWIGPIFQPPDHACWHCLASRLSAHRQAESHAQTALGHDTPVVAPAASVPPLQHAVMQLVALEATKWLAGYRYPGQHAVWVLDSLTMTSRHHELRARPQCAECGNPELMREQAHRPVLLQSVRRAPGAGGGHRAAPARETLERYQHLVSPITGVIKEIRRDNRGPAFFSSFRSGPNVAMQTRGLDSLRAALRQENGGKGVTDLDAEVGALCEAVERFSGSYQGDEERVRGSLTSLGDEALDPRTIQLYHDRQFPSRTEWNAAHSNFQHVCSPFNENAVMDWTPVWSLTEKRHRLLPTGMLYFGAPAEQGPCYVHADSNGNAAGGSIEDAILQGALEVVERDAVALWWYNRTAMPGVDLGAFADPWIDELVQVYAGLGREVWVLDVTSDLGIPVLAAVSRRTGEGPEEIMLGFGAHLDPRIALRRALTELNQMMPAVSGSTSDGRRNWDDPDAVRWFREATVANQPYLRPDPAVPARTPGDYEYQPSPDLRDAVEAVHAKVVERGMQMLVLDQTRPDIGMPVVKVIVPGMRQFWARFGSGRLYDVPVQLGRLETPTRYEDLNPIPLFL